MKKAFVILLAAMLFTPRLQAQNQWMDLSKSLNELDIRTVAIDHQDSKVIFAGCEKHLYKTDDSGGSWKQILGLRGNENKLHYIYIDPLDSKTIYACTDKGIERSLDGGKRWAPFYGGVEDRAKTVYYVTRNIQDPRFLWAGTRMGLFLVDARTADAKKLSSLPELAVYSILTVENAPNTVLVTTDHGIYKSADRGKHWNHALGAIKSEENSSLDVTVLGQFNIEELSEGVSSGPAFSNLIFSKADQKFYAGTRNGVFQSPKDGVVWDHLSGQNLPDQKIKWITQTSKTFYVATNRGLFGWNTASESFYEIFEGLPSKEIQFLAYSPQGDFLIAGTKKGLFKLTYPELEISLPENREMMAPKAGDILDRFKNEPTITDIQNAAIAYAEVHPGKIEAWRKAAARRAFLPTLSVGGKMNQDQKIDIDRGGTNDPDKFILGPQEQNTDWSATLNWNLGDLIWNNDQTSIDTRSRLMVELRNDVLNEVTHLYYERRRLEVEMALASTRDLSVEIEKKLRLEELTACIYGLTGGYLSEKLGKIKNPSQSH